MDAEQEAQRLKRLHELGVLDTRQTQVFRDLLERALAQVPGTSIAAVSLIDADRQWFKAIIGLDVKETPRDISFCTHTIEAPDVMVVEDATRDPRFAGNPLVTSSPAIRFYAGVKLTSGVGALCVIGQQPRQATDQEIAKLIKLAQYVDILLLAHGTLFNLPGALPEAD
jgi:GAF domain-containing protein